MTQEFSFRTRQIALKRFREETFDLLIIGGGITGAATARDAVTRGLKVALVEARDFAWGTSSRSSKLIHGGLRYLQNMELRLVFEALSERSHLLKVVPNVVRPLPFYMPVYRGDYPGKTLLSIGLWLYDLLSLFRTPGFHRRLSKKYFLEKIPFLKPEGLQGGFHYYDASMWDDVLAVETLRDAQSRGAVVANYVEAMTPLWERGESDRIVGFQVRDKEEGSQDNLISLRAQRVVVCAGPWTDQVGATLSPNWRPWLNPSKGVHLIFDLKRIPVPGALVLAHQEDKRISFVIPRPDFGAGVVIVGTTDGATPQDPEKADIDFADVDYLMRLLQKYFPKLNLTTEDIISAYVGVRPLMGTHSSTAGSEGQTAATAMDLQKISREHYIGEGPGGVVLVAGGKYTTHRTMAKEIVDVTLEKWNRDAQKGITVPVPETGPSRTENVVNPEAVAAAVEAGKAEAVQKNWKIPDELWDHYGAGALKIMEIARAFPSTMADPEGFPLLEAQFRYALRQGMVLHLEDFFLRRLPLYSSRVDHGTPWIECLARVWGEEMGQDPSAISIEIQRLKEEFDRRSAWKKKLSGAKTLFQ